MVQRRAVLQMRPKVQRTCSTPAAAYTDRRDRRPDRSRPLDYRCRRTSSAYANHCFRGVSISNCYRVLLMIYTVAKRCNKYLLILLISRLISSYLFILCYDLFSYLFTPWYSRMFIFQSRSFKK